MLNDVACLRNKGNILYCFERSFHSWSEIGLECSLASLMWLAFTRCFATLARTINKTIQNMNACVDRMLDALRLMVIQGRTGKCNITDLRVVMDGLCT